MIKNMQFVWLWVGLFIYASIFAPPQQPNTWTLIKDLSLGQLEGINPAIVALFYIMGVWPGIYACLMLIDGTTQKIKAWQFLLVSFGVGAFAILPYLAMRVPNSDFSGQKDRVLQVVDSRWIGFALTLMAGALVTYGLLGGDWNNFAQQWQTNRFIHVMGLDFCFLCLLFPVLLKDDMARRGLNNPAIFWAVSLVPLFGSLAYLCLRPPLPELNPEGKNWIDLKSDSSY